MSARRVQEALEEFARPIAAALLTVTESRIKQPVTSIHAMSSLSLQHRVALLRRPTGMTNLLFDFTLGFQVDQISASQSRSGLRVTTTSWEYTVYDLEERELLAFHWHPQGVSQRKFPHLHIGSILIDSHHHELGKTFSRLHLPTGIISIADVARMLIEEFNVVPISRHWDENLRSCQEAFERQRSHS